MNRRLEPPDPPLCHSCGEFAQPGDNCPACGSYNYTQSEIDEIKGEERAERMREEAGMPDDQWEPSF